MIKREGEEGRENLRVPPEKKGWLTPLLRGKKKKTKKNKKQKKEKMMFSWGGGGGKKPRGLCACM